MKSTIRITSAAVAAVMCAVCLSACVKGSSPTLADAVTDTPTTVAPVTDVPEVMSEVPSTTEITVTTDAPATTEAPTATVPATTEPPVTTTVSATTEAPVTTTVPATTEAPVTTTVPVTTEAPVIVEKKPLPEEIKEPFASILMGDGVFRMPGFSKDITISALGASVTKFATVDLDGDGKDELVLELMDFNIAVLSEAEDTVAAISFRHSSMYSINKDGTFYWNANGGKTYGCSRLQFTNGGFNYQTTDLYRVEHGDDGSVLYFVNGSAVSEAELKQAADQIPSNSIEWFKMSDYK